MKTNAAVLWELNKPWSIEEIDLDGPKEGEVLVSFEATGLCHSDHHVADRRLAGVPLPIIGGHEGAGVVQEIGPGVRGPRSRRPRGGFVPAGVRPLPLVCQRTSEPVRYGRDHPAGHCRPMAPTVARSAGKDVGVMVRRRKLLSSYGTVSETSLVKIDDDLPLSRACLLGCGVMTGWGSAVNTADVTPGDTVVVIGCGGIGSGAIQGARLAGAEQIVVVDIVETKRDKAFEFGATHFVTSMPEAATAIVAETHPRRDGGFRAVDGGRARRAR